jgi:hypothetical protein
MFKGPLNTARSNTVRLPLKLSNVSASSERNDVSVTELRLARSWDWHWAGR